MKKIRKQLILAISILFLALVVCSTAAAADVSDNSTVILASNQTIGQLAGHNSNSDNSLQTNSSDKNSTNSSSNTVISGHVKKCSSGEPFTGVKVTARKNGAVVASTTTKADGSYTLEFQSNSGVFTVTASSLGHNPSSKEVTVKSGSDGTLQGSADFQLGMDNVYVSTAGSDTNGDGTQAHPYQTIRKGITEVNANGTVHLADGTYQGHDNMGLTIDKNLTITGQSQVATVIDAKGADRIFTINQGVNAIIYDLKLENGNVTGDGGAIENKGTLTVNNCTFTNNTANGSYPDGYAGAIFNDIGTLTVTGSTFDNNTASSGGAIYNRGTLIVNNSTFSDNNQSAIFSEDSLTVNNSIFSGNTGSAGAILASNILTVTNCTFTNNKARYNGGAICADTLTVIGSTFSVNNASFEGGAIFTMSPSSTIVDSIFLANAAGQGGAIANLNNLAVENCIFSGNNASQGGAIYNSNWVTLSVKNSTFINNMATDWGGAVYNAGTFNITGSNFEKNTASEGSAVWSYGSNVIYKSFLNFNRIIGNTPFSNEIEVSGRYLDANFNWWGSNAGPVWEVCDKWIILTITADPTKIDNGGTSQVTSDLLYDNTGVYHDPALGHVPDIPITLTVPWGSFTGPVITHSITLNTVNGSVESNFYANEGTTPSPNLVPVRATADSYTTSDTESAYIQIVQEAKLSITEIDSPDPVIAGNSITYTVTITNNGPASAEGVTLDDVIGNNGAFKAGTLKYRFKLNDGTWSDWFSFTNPLNLDLGTILNGKTAVIEINGIVDSSTPKGTVINNTATADTTTTPDPKVVTSTTVVSTLADVNLTKTVDNKRPDVGDVVLFKVKARNNGPSDATNIKIGDKLPYGFANVHITLPTGTSYVNGIWTIPYLASGEETTLTLRVVVTPYLAGKTTINTAIKTAEDQYDPTADAASASIYVQPIKVIIQKTSILAIYNIFYGEGISTKCTDPTVKAASKTTGMDPTGIPLTGFAVAVLMVLSGLIIPRKK